MKDTYRMTKEEKESISEAMTILKGMKPESRKMLVMMAKGLVIYEGIRNEGK